MKAYQTEYLELLRAAAGSSRLPAEKLDPEAFARAAGEAARAAQQAVSRGTQLLREELFPVLDNILSAPEEEVRSVSEFAGKLMSGTAQKDVGLHYQIHLALLARARHRKDRDMLIRELYLVGMSLYNMETMLDPNKLRLFTTRMRMCFAESASYFDTQYDEITDPETRGYIHRSMGNIALSYDTSDPVSAKAKLAAATRSINILSDPEIQAKTPSLPWDTYLYKSHQERTTLLSYLRSGQAGPEAFAQVLESAQLVQERQLRTARERGEPLQPRWQYAYMAARYHCGAMLLPELLEGLYSLSTAQDDDDYGVQSMFSHAGVPAFYLEYAKQPGGPDDAELAGRVDRMTRRMLAWIVRAPSSDNDEMLLLSARQFLYTYREFPGGMPFFDVLQDVFAACHPAAYARLWIAGQTARQLTLWAVEDCPEKLVGLPECACAEDVRLRRDAVADLARQAGRLYDAGMVHFFGLENAACRGLFEEEEAVVQLHAHCGAQLLAGHPSTALFADVARGHHRHFDDMGGYPVDFSLRASPLCPLISLVAAADCLVASNRETSSRYRPAVPFEQACAQLLDGAGTRYAPFVSALLRSPQRQAQLRDALERWKKEAYLDLYRRREQMLRY